LNLLDALDASVRQTLSKQLYVGAITCLETYLSDAFINTVLAQEKYLRAYFRTFPGFQERTIKISNIFGFIDKVEDEAKKEMKKMLYHNLRSVMRMYKAALSISFPPSALIFKAISIRHDLVHRNGKTTNDAEVDVDADKVAQLLSEIESFVEDINCQVLNKKWNEET
jgi:hypothetical protein